MSKESPFLENNLENPLKKPAFPEVRFKKHFMSIPTFIIYCLLNLQNALSISSYTPIEKTLNEYYQLKTSIIVFTSSIFLIANAISGLLVYPVGKHWGITNSIRLSLLLNLIGAALRTLINHHFGWVILGQFFIGMSSCFVYNNQMEFNFNWFHPKSRAIFNAILTLSVYIGGGLGNSVPLFFINPTGIHNEAEGHRQVYHYSLYMFYFILALCIVTLIIFRGQPPAGYG